MDVLGEDGIERIEVVAGWVEMLDMIHEGLKAIRDIRSEQSLGQLGSVPVWSVHPFCHIVPIYMPSVAMQSPLSRQISGEPVVLRIAQQPLTLEFDLHGAYEESRGVPLSP